MQRRKLLKRIGGVTLGSTIVAGTAAGDGDAGTAAHDICHNCTDSCPCYACYC